MFRKVKFQYRIVVLILLVVSTFACSTNKHEHKEEGAIARQGMVSQNKLSETEVNKNIPDGVNFSIINEDIMQRIKRSLAVRLNKKVSEETLKKIAIQLKKSDYRKYERTFIEYYLEDMKVNSRAWAITHFNPNLEVKILGLSLEQEARI